MDVQIYNTLTRRKETFQPIESGKVRMYNCGPTVYDQAHIGNMRSYIMADLMRRTFEYLGYEVRQVINITDVGHLTSDADEGEDRMLVGVRRTGRDPWEIAARFTELFFKDTAALNILRPHVAPRATEHIPEMIELVQRLEAAGYTYEIDDGVYFDVSRLPNYGRLSGQMLDEMRAGARVEVNPQKRHPADFALWRVATPERIMQWDSPWGRGYPGWHIECSAMSMKYLGETLDVHTGGEDHISLDFTTHLKLCTPQA
jgi:cysteinyl-tRNA synthetase